MVVFCLKRDGWVRSVDGGAGRADGMNNSRISRNGPNGSGVVASTAQSVTSTGWRAGVWLRASPRWRAGELVPAGAAGASSQAVHVTGQQLAVSLWSIIQLVGLMSRVAGPGHHHYRTRCHPVKGRSGSDCMHESEIQAEAEVEADFQASCLVGLNRQCMVVVVVVVVVPGLSRSG